MLEHFDKEIIEQIKFGNESAFLKLYEAYWDKLYFVCYSRIKLKEETEDILQDLFIELWNRRDKIEIKTSVSAYLFTALKYKIFRWIEHKNVKKKYLVLSEDEELFGSEQNTDKKLLFDELYYLIEQNIEKLPKKCKLIFKLSREENLTATEISTKLKISPNTVNNQITKAKKIIKFELSKVFTLFLQILIFFISFLEK